MRTTGAIAAFIVGSAVALSAAHSHQPGAGGAQGKALRETVTVAAEKAIPNIPGKRLASLIVDYPPGASSDPHRHAGSAFIYAHVLDGEIRSQVDGEPVRIYRAGETWFESPGAHHRVSANASDTKPARLLAIFIVDSTDEPLTTTDPD
jgi:quercetin dioxygenase-like cupin family protein